MRSAGGGAGSLAAGVAGAVGFLARRTGACVLVVSGGGASTGGAVTVGAITGGATSALGGIALGAAGCATTAGRAARPAGPPAHRPAAAALEAGTGPGAPAG